MGAKVEYNKMNELYNALYGDMTSQEIKNLYFIIEHEELLKEYDPNKTSIIDASCGNGVKTTAIAMKGYKVTGTDISEEMVKLAKEFAMKHNVEIDTKVKAWTELPEAYKEEFDIVLCIGNSLVHSPDKKERKGNLEAFSKILKSNGTLVIETRNWDKIIRGNKGFTITDNKTSYKDSDYITLYHWILNGMEEESKVEILLQEIDDKGKVYLHTNELTFTPFSHKTLTNMLEDLNLKITKDTYLEDAEWYYVYTEKV